MSSAPSAAVLSVEGRVQGVGFRDYVWREASRLGLTGYVMNLSDGTVSVHAEGARDAIETLARALHGGPPRARVGSVGVRWLPPTRRFASFEIRFGRGSW